MNISYHSKDFNGRASTYEACDPAGGKEFRCVKPIMHPLACYKDVPGKNVSPAKALQKVTLSFTSTLSSDIAKFIWKFV